MRINPKAPRTFTNKLKLYHKVFKKNGLYRFLLVNILKLLFILSLIIFGIIALDHYFDLEKLLENLIQKHSIPFVLIVFFVSESILGWIPPDLFIAWTEQFHHPLIWVLLLGTISYIGGINSYYLGRLILKFPKIRRFIETRNEIFFKRIKKWGGILIIFAALFPLPYATTALVAGIVKYPVKNFLLFGLTRYLRFILYALIIFKALDTVI